MHQDAIRAAYDTVAEDYLAFARHELATKPFELGMLAAFAALTTGPVVEAGCGPGRITAHLRDLGLDASGVDLSPEMITVARRAYPDLRFEVGSMTALDLPDGTLGGLVSWYSIVHTPTADLPAFFAEFHRVLAPGGHLLLAFKAGDQVHHLDHAYGHPLSLDVHWHQPDQVAAAMTAAGFTEAARLTRVADAQEGGPQACLLGRR